jgi:hypothetical protein
MLFYLHDVEDGLDLDRDAPHIVDIETFMAFLHALDSQLMFLIFKKGGVLEHGTQGYRLGRRGSGGRHGRRRGIE